MKQMSECRICLSIKPHTVRGNGKLQTMCADCKSEYNKKYYIVTKEKHNPARALRRNKVRQELTDYIRRAKNVPCTDCGQEYHYCQMQFDHVHGKKEFSIGEGIAKAITVSLLKEEMDKCEVVCANCHFLRTFLRNQAPLA